MPGTDKELLAAVEQTYKENPSLIPFANGDRAKETGNMSATVFAAKKIAKCAKHKTVPKQLEQRVARLEKIVRGLRGLLLSQYPEEK